MRVHVESFWIVVLSLVCAQCVGILPGFVHPWLNLVMGVSPSNQRHFWYCDRYATYTIYIFGAVDYLLSDDG